MRARTTWLALAALFLVCACEKSDEKKAADLGYTVGDVFVASDIADKEPVGIAEHFFADTPKLYCFSEILGAENPVVIRHKWYQGETLVSETALDIRSVKWRTWSAKTLGEGATGDWRVDVTSEDGAVLKTTKFHVGQ